MENNAEEAIQKLLKNKNYGGKKIIIYYIFLSIVKNQNKKYF